MRVNFEIELFSNALAFIRINGKRRGFVAKVPSNPPSKRWYGQLRGKKTELRISGSELHELNFEGVIYKYNDKNYRKPESIQIYC